MELVPKLILILLVFGVTFSLISFSIQFGDIISGSVVKISETTPFSFVPILILITVFLIISLLIFGLIKMRKV